MREPTKISSMKERNLHDLEKVRKSTRASLLYQKRYDKYYMVEYELEEAIDSPEKIQNILDSVPIIAHDILSGDFIIVMLEDHGATQSLIQRGIISHLLRFLETSQGYVQIKAAEVLYKLINESPEQIIDHGGAATIVRLLDSSHIRVKVKALRAMACARDLPRQYRDALLDHGAVTQLVALLGPLVELPMLTAAHGSEPEQTLFYRGVQTLPALCSGDPLPAFHLVEILIPIVRRIILVNNPIGIYSEISADACLTLYYILKRLETSQLQEFVNAELCQRLLILMQTTNEELAEAVHLLLRKLMRSQAIVLVLIDHGLIPALNQNLNDAPAYQAKACKTVFAFINYRRVTVQVLLDGNLIHQLLQIIQDEFGEDEVKVLAVSVLAQAVNHGSVEHINLMVNLGCIPPLCEYLNNTVTRAYCILGLRKIIQKGNGQRVDNVNVYAELIGQLGGDTIRSLQNDEDVGRIARWIMMYI